MAQVRLQSLTKQFKQAKVLKRIDLTIRDGEFFTLAGPSGCGKSTLLNLIAGLESPTSGEIYFDETKVTDLPPGERDVAFVFQSYALYPHMTVFENIAFPLRIRKIGAETVREKVVEAARLLGLEPLLGRYPKALSGGQRQRVALGRAIVRRPKLFLLDEPLSNLDALLRVEMRSEIKKLHRQLRTTVIYVTHDQAEAMILSDRIAVMEGGEIRQCGAPEEIYNRPANRFVAGFIGTPPMNFVKGRFLAGETFRIDFGTGFFSFPETSLAALPEKARGSDVLFGFRPEEVLLSVHALPDATKGKIEVLEPMGSETWALFTVGEKAFRGKAPADFPARAGDPVWIRLDPKKLHFFDLESGERIDSTVGG